MPKPKRRRRWLIVLAIFVLLAAGWGWHALHKPAEEIIVQVEKVSRRDITETVTASGHIQPVTQVTINPEVAGEIVSLPVKEGQFVKKGDLLLEIKPDNYLAEKSGRKPATSMSGAGQP